jgi:hypothetical protein
MADDLLTLPSICAKFHVSERRARQIVHDHGVPVLKPGREWLFDDTAVRAFTEATRLCPSKSSVAKVRKPGGSRARSRAGGFEKALALTIVR